MDEPGERSFATQVLVGLVLLVALLAMLQFGIVSVVGEWFKQLMGGAYLPGP